MTTPTLRRTGMVYARAAFEVAVLAAVRQPTHWDRTSVSLVPDPPPRPGLFPVMAVTRQPSTGASCWPFGPVLM